MKFEYNLSMTEIVLTFIAMIAVVLIGGFTQQWWLMGFALPLFLRALIGWCPIKSLLSQRKYQQQ